MLYTKVDFTDHIIKNYTWNNVIKQLSLATCAGFGPWATQKLRFYIENFSEFNGIADLLDDFFDNILWQLSIKTQINLLTKLYSKFTHEQIIEIFDKIENIHIKLEPKMKALELGELLEMFEELEILKIKARRMSIYGFGLCGIILHLYFQICSELLKRSAINQSSNKVEFQKKWLDYMFLELLECHRFSNRTIIYFNKMNEERVTIRADQLSKLQVYVNGQPCNICAELTDELRSTLLPQTFAEAETLKRTVVLTLNSNFHSKFITPFVFCNQQYGNYFEKLKVGLLDTSS